MNKEKYLAKIKKLLRLARGTSSPEEAANAMAKAQAFMREYGLSESDVEFATINTADSAGAPSDAARSPAYMHHLANMLCRAFGVECYFSGSWRSTGSLKRFVRFYGPGQRAEIAAYAFDVLSRQMKLARKEYQTRHCKRCKPATRIARGDQFCEGWVGGASGIITSFGISPEEKGMLERYTKKLHAEKGLCEGEARSAKSCRGSDDAVGAGYLAGKSARLHHGVGGHADLQPLAIGRR